MPRVTALTSKDMVPTEAHEAFDSIEASRGRVGGPFAILMHSPEVAARTAHLGTRIRFESSLPDWDREFASMTTAREMECGHEWTAHIRYAREAGIPEPTIEAVAKRAPLDAFSADEALIVACVRGLLTDHKISDDTFEAARSKYGDQGAIELAATIGYYAMLACSLNAADFFPPDPMW